MSGIAGLLSLDGAPIDRRLLGIMTKFMHYRGPDAREIWVGDRVGFGHVMLRTTFESQHERQPCSLDGRVWIAADARVDGRSELVQKLQSTGQDCPQSASDAELILYAYRVWGEECVRHLIGDFAFLIWDDPQQRLFCARDHFGVKPFYYAQVGSCVVFSNTLGCVRAHPAVSDELNDLAISDFLLYGSNQDEANTTFADIRRLPPAHRLTWSEDMLRVDRYWNLPLDGHLRYRNANDYVDHFREKLNLSVADRLRSDRVGVFMSGGLDSTSIAATARSLLSRQNGQFDLRAYTCVYDRLIPDEERCFAGLAADALRIPIRYLVADDYSLFERWHEPELHLPEPADHPLSALSVDQMSQMVDYSRVALTGWDGDAVLNDSGRVHRGILDKGRRMVRRAAACGWRALSQHRWLEREMRARPKRVLAGAPEHPFACPRWLNAELVNRLDLPGRWQSLQEGARRDNCTRPGAHRVLTSPCLSWLLESYDPGVTQFPLEARHPLLDIRLVAYVLSVPPAPWCVDKTLLRVAMRDRLPDAVRQRPKTPLAGDPVFELLQRPDARWVDDFKPTPELGRYVDRGAIPPLAGANDVDESWINLRPLCLSLWLQRFGNFRQCIQS